ncbi:MAG: hemagglutinin, partial [Comamonadaceae bacterium]
MAPDVTVRADATGANGNGGTVAVGSLGFAHVSGNLSAQGAGSGAGGQVLTSGGVIEVSNTAKVNASGGATGANGTWAVNSSLDLTVTNTVPAYDAAAYPTGTTAVNAGAIGAALGRGTDVVLNSSAAVSTGRSEGIGVAFAPNIQVVKTEGRESTLTVNSVGSIVMGKNSGIGSSAGALNLNFNADSKGAPLPESLPINNRTDTPDLRTGAIFLNGATVQTAGGNVNFYGQSDPLAGRAVGLVSSTTDGVTTLLPVGGVTLTQSTVSTCAIGSAACTNGGSISMRGQGSSVQITDTAVFSSAGVDIMGSTLQTGSGAISLDGRGGLGSAGVRLAQADTQAGSIDTTLRSASGDVTLIGGTRARAGGGRLIVAGSGEGAGVAIGNTSLQTGGNVRIEGAGGAIDNVAIVGADGETPVSGQLGTSIVNSRIVAGAGRSISVTGTAGSRGFENVDGTLVPVAFDANAVQILTGANGPSMSTAGGQIRIDGQGGDVTLGLTADAGSQTALSVASPTGAGGSIQVDGRNILVTGSAADAILRLDATGAGQSGSVTLRARAVNGVAGSGILAMNRNVTIDASSGTAVGNGGEVRLLGERSLYAYGTVTARGGSTGGNGGFVETSGAFAIPETATQNQDGFIGGGLVLNGFRVDASAPAGKAGTWLIDPQNVTIQNGGATDTLPPGNPSVYVPLVDSTIQDSDISAALNAGTDVRITTGTGGPPDQGDIFMDDAQIVYNVAAGTRTLTLDAHRSVRANGGTTIAAYGAGGPLNVVFNANANNASPPPDGGQVSYSGNIYTNGGNVVMNGSWGNATNLGASIALDGEVIDTRAGNQLGVGPGGYAGGSDALAGGSVQLNGRSNIAPLGVGNVPGEQAGAVFL